jgi:hypothetical protein
MSLPITYWDMMGWKDTLASEANTRRQKFYSEIMGHGGVYTPQMIVDGVSDVIGSREATVEAAIALREGDMDAVPVLLHATRQEIHVVVGPAPAIMTDRTPRSGCSISSARRPSASGRGKTKATRHLSQYRARPEGDRNLEGPCRDARSAAAGRNHSAARRSRRDRATGRLWPHRRRRDDRASGLLNFPSIIDFFASQGGSRGGAETRRR